MAWWGWLSSPVHWMMSSRMEICFGTLQLVYFGGDDVFDLLGVCPIGTIHDPRDNDLGQPVHEVRHFTCRGLPVGGHALIGFPAEEEHVGSVLLVYRETLQLRTPEEVVPFQVPALGTFEKTVERQQIPHDEFAHGGSPPRANRSRLPKRAALAFCIMRVWNARTRSNFRCHTADT